MNNNDDLHFETIDFKERRVVCTRYDWFTHVVRRGHEYMEGQESDVVDVLQHPDHGIRHIDKNYPTRRIYYKASKTKDYFLKVVVEFEDESCNRTGKIVTAYMPDDIKPGEKPEL